MSSGSTKLPKAPDPQMLIDAQTRANRVNQIGPYGSSIYSTDAEGNATQTNTLSPELEAVRQRVFGLAGQQPQQAQSYQLPQGYEQLMNAVGGRVGERYGLGAAKPSQQPMQAPMQGGSQDAQRAAMSSGQDQPGMFGSMGSGMFGSMGSSQGSGAMAAALQRALSNQNKG